MTCSACLRAAELNLTPPLCSIHLDEHRAALTDKLIEDLLGEAHFYHHGVDALCGPGPDPSTGFRRRVRILLEAYKAAT